jgi:hypothetical protein
MPFGSNAELQATVATWAKRSDQAANIPDFITWAHEEICRKLRAPILYNTAQITLDGSETLPAPDDFLAPKRLYLDTSPRRFLHLKDLASLVEMTGNLSPTDFPTHFGVMGRGTLAFAPLYNGSITGELLYYAAPPALVNDTDTNVVLAAYPFLYLYGALEALFRYLEDDNNCDRFGALFGALIQSINDEEAADAMKGPLQGAASGYIV